MFGFAPRPEKLLILDVTLSKPHNSRPYLDPPMYYLFGSPSKSPNQKTIPNPKKYYIGGSR